MAYLKNFKRLLAAKKVLRLLATKLRLHKLQRSKPARRKIKKRPATKGGGSGGSRWLSLSSSFQSRFKRKRREVHRYPRKKTMPVYVDQLFLDTKQLEMPVAEGISGTAVVETSGKGGGVADDMWESLVELPQMDGINERAEEFISRFRADLLVQEIRARRL